VAITRVKTTSDINDFSAIMVFAQEANGITSVGLNAVALVRPRYR
jgi:hypothetical protein